MSSPASSPRLPPVLSQSYAAFRRTRFGAERDRFRSLAEFGQKPPVLVIGCCDSRVAPEILFEAHPGDLFTVRNIAALMPPHAPGTTSAEAAALEYAVLALEVAHVVVLGHSRCGGVRAYAQGQAGRFAPLSDADAVSAWVRLMQPAAARVEEPATDFDGYCEHLCCAAVAQSVANLRSFPYVAEREAAGSLSLHGAYVSIEDARLSVLDEATGRLVPCDEGS